MGHKSTLMPRQDIYESFISGKPRGLGEVDAQFFQLLSVKSFLVCTLSLIYHIQMLLEARQGEKDTISSHLYELIVLAVLNKTGRLKPKRYGLPEALENH